MPSNLAPTWHLLGTDLAPTWHHCQVGAKCLKPVGTDLAPLPSWCQVTWHRLGTDLAPLPSWCQVTWNRLGTDARYVSSARKQVGAIPQENKYCLLAVAPFIKNIRKKDSIQFNSIQTHMESLFCLQVCLQFTGLKQRLKQTLFYRSPCVHLFGGWGRGGPEAFTCSKSFVELEALIDRVTATVCLIKLV